jgi:predicted DNA-binding antitoxin AbrB/MazE fold protein
VKTIRATYQNGVLRHAGPLGLPEGTRIRIAIQESDSLARARERFRSVIGTIPPDELKQMEADIREAFGEAEPHDWQ